MILMSGSLWAQPAGTIKIVYLTSSAPNPGCTVAMIYRGGDGPVGTSNGNNRKNPLYQAFIDAGEEAGYGRN